MPPDMIDPWDEYDEATLRVVNARHQDFSALLRRWFSSLDEIPGLNPDLIHALETRWTWERVASEVMQEQDGMGSGTLNWPDARHERLGGQLTLFRHLASSEDKDEAWRFAHDFFYTRSNRIDDILHEMTEHLFEPFASELKRYLLRTSVSNEATLGVPASDRVVRLDHNLPEYQHSVKALSELEASVKGSNELDELERDRFLFELRSGALLLQAQTVRAEAVYELLIKSLKWLASKFADGAIGYAAGAALALLGRLIGFEI